MKEEEEQLLKSVYKKKMDLNENDEDTDYDKVMNIFESFVNMHNMGKKDFLKKVFDSAFKLIPEAEKGSFYELSGEEYVPILTRGYDFELLKKLVFKRSDAFNDFECSDVSSIDAYQIYINKRDETKFTKEMIDVFKELGTYSNFTSLYAPVQVDGLNVGLLSLDRFNRTDFSKNSKKILKFYAQIISNFYSQKVFHDKETKMYDDIVSALVSAIEVKDKYTEGHARRVREYSCDIAIELGLSKEQVRDIGTAALLHDIGKIGISTEILNKPGKLTDYEFDIIKLHPLYTKTILEKISDFASIANIAYSHHENYDGSGYPEGLKGDETPFESQIIQVADAYDAMTSERAYRKALSKSEALEIIRKNMGSQFNNEIAKVAMKLFSI